MPLPQAPCPRLLARVWGRVRQFAVLGRTRATPEDAALAAAHLTPPEYALWQRLSGRDRGHTARVLRRLLADGAGPVDPALARAALLHDVGKALTPVSLLDRVALVLLHAAGEPWLSRLLRPDGRLHTGRLYVLHHHARLGADLARAAGTPEGAVTLIARHDDPPGTDPRLQRLRAADRE